jgi:hypothetical protein
VFWGCVATRKQRFEPSRTSSPSSCFSSRRQTAYVASQRQTETPRTRLIAPAEKPLPQVGGELARKDLQTQAETLLRQLAGAAGRRGCLCSVIRCVLVCTSRGLSEARRRGRKQLEQKGQSISATERRRGESERVWRRSVMQESKRVLVFAGSDEM